MNARPHTASAARLWLVEGFALLRKQPLLLISMVFLFFMLTLFFRMLPLPLEILTGLLIPGLAAGLLHACAHVRRGERLLPTTLTSAFFTEQRQRALPLLLLGAIYMVLSLLTSAFFTEQRQRALPLLLLGAIYMVLSFSAISVLLLLVDPEAVLKQLAEGDLQWLPPLLSIVAVPLWILYFYPPLLVAWYGLNPPKALFIGIMAILRNLAPFLVLGVFVLLLSMAAALLLGTLGSLLGNILGKTILEVLFYLAALTLITLMLCCTYVSTLHILEIGPAAPADDSADSTSATDEPPHE